MYIEYHCHFVNNFETMYHLCCKLYNASTSLSNYEDNNQIIRA